MSSRFIGRPPQPVPYRSLPRHFIETLRGIWLIVWQIFVPFNPEPESIDPLPEPTIELTDEQVTQCQSIYDQATERTSHLEQKAQSTFSVMVFLAPVLASLFVFIITRASPAGAPVRVTVMILLCVSIAFLLLGFVSAVRAIGVKATQKLFIHSIVESDGRFRQYNKAFHARGLLYCAAINEAANDHLAQFVKGAHVFSAAAVVPLVAAAVLASFVLSNLPSPIAQTKIVGSVDISSTEIAALREDIINLKDKIGELLSKNQAAERNLESVQRELSKLDASLGKMQPGHGVREAHSARPESGGVWSPLRNP